MWSKNAENISAKSFRGVDSAMGEVREGSADQHCKKDVVGSKLMLRASAFNVFSHNSFNKSQLFSFFFCQI